MTNPQVSRNHRLQYFFDRPNYTVVAGGTVTLTISIQESFNPGNDESLLAPGTDGLIRAGVFIEPGIPRPKHPAFVGRTAAILGNTRFDFAVLAELPGVESPGAGIVEFSSEPVYGEVVSRRPTCETVLLPLASFTFTAGKVPGEVTFLTAMVSEDYAQMSGERIVTYTGVVLDALIQPADATITVCRAAPPDARGDVGTRTGHRYP